MVGALYRQQQKEIDDLRIKLNSLTNQYNDSQESLKQKEAELESKNNEIKTLNDNASEKKKALDKLVADHEQALQKLQDEDEAKLVKATEEFDNKKSELEAQIREITAAKTQLEGEKSTLEQGLNTAKSESERLSGELDKALATNNSCAGYTKAKGELREKLSGLSDNYYEKEKELFDSILSKGLKNNDSLQLKMSLNDLINAVEKTVLLDMREAQKATEEFKEGQILRFVGLVAQAVEKNANDLDTTLKQTSTDRITKFKSAFDFKIEESLKVAMISLYQEYHQTNPFEGFDWNWKNMIDNYEALTAHRGDQKPAMSALNYALGNMMDFE